MTDPNDFCTTDFVVGLHTTDYLKYSELSIDIFERYTLKPIFLLAIKYFTL